MLQRRQAIFRGRVQGVGFRYQAQQIASRHAVMGFVKNLHDGSVQAIVEGDSAEIDRFLAELQRTMHDCIADCQTTELPYAADFHEFSIRPTGEAVD